MHRGAVPRCVALGPGVMRTGEYWSGVCEPNREGGEGWSPDWWFCIGNVWLTGGLFTLSRDWLPLGGAVFPWLV